MHQRMSSFFLTDDTARWRAILWSWLAGSIAGALAATSTKSLGNLAFLSVGVSLVVFGGFVFSSAGAAHRRVVTIKSRRVFMDYAYATIAAGAFVAMERVFTNPETVHAAAVRIVDAINGKTAVREDQIVAVRAALEIIGKRNMSPVVRKRIVADYSVISAASAYNEVLKRISINPGNHIKQMTLKLGGPGSGGIAIESSMLAEDLEITGTYRTSHGVSISCTSCDVVVLGGRFENVTQKLDFGTWFKVQFINCDISYTGGRVVLFQCAFDNCKFEFAPSVGPELTQMIVGGTGVSPTPPGLQ